MIEWIRGAILGAQVVPSATPAIDALPKRVVLRRGRLVPWLGGRLSGMGAPAAAVTIGRTIILRPGVDLTPGLLAHELAHVRQWESDLLFPIRYSWATFRHGYRDNPYEVEAREAEVSGATADSDQEAIEWNDPS
ncbi:MAG: DUF4157 domain-containing protein [Gemmatimonas sp.]|nr:DUF4157 domain-containing protein [Gemmatimonas sp.]